MERLCTPTAELESSLPTDVGTWQIIDELSAVAETVSPEFLVALGDKMLRQRRVEQALIAYALAEHRARMFLCFAISLNQGEIKQAIEALELAGYESDTALDGPLSICAEILSERGN